MDPRNESVQKRCAAAGRERRADSLYTFPLGPYRGDPAALAERTPVRLVRLAPAREGRHRAACAARAARGGVQDETERGGEHLCVARGTRRVEQRCGRHFDARAALLDETQRLNDPPALQQHLH